MVDMNKNETDSIDKTSTFLLIPIEKDITIGYSAF